MQEIKSMKVRIVNRIKEFRNERGLTQQELARAVGVSRQSIISIERGRYVPSLELALKFSAFFRTATDDLFAREEKTS
jgi:putative transcriptional regulator